MLIKWQSFPPFFYNVTKISNMAVGGHSNVTAVGNNKSFMWSQKNSLVMFTFKFVEGNILAAF